MTTPDTICFGTLFKTGGKGHTVKNQKLRWCALQGTFLTYYIEKPDLSGKAFDKLKGQLYLEGCLIRDADPVSERENSFIITNAGGKEYIFTPTIDKEECTMWKNAIFYVLKKVKIFADSLAGEPLASGWLLKKGGKGHKTQNWKKRYFVLQGQFLNYFDRANARLDDLTGLKGWINLTEITELSNDEDPEDGCEKPHYLKINTTNEKGYFLVAKNEEEKKQWFFRLKRQLDLFFKTYELPQTNLVIEEKEVKAGFLLRLSGTEWRKTWVVLTNLNIRFYKGDTRKNPTDLGKQLFETIKLVGISIEESKGKSKDCVMKLVDVLGHAYSLSIVEAEFKQWVDVIKKTASTLVTTIINKGESININCRTTPEDANDKSKRQEYTQVKLTKDTLGFFFLLSNARVDIPLKNIEKMTDVGGVFYLKYQFEGKVQELRIKSSNVQGLYSTINTVLEMYREKNKPLTEPVRPSEQEEFTFENTYLSDSFFDKMERDVEAEASSAATDAEKPEGAPTDTVASQIVTNDTKPPEKPAPEPPKPVEAPKPIINTPIPVEIAEPTAPVRDVPNNESQWEKKPVEIPVRKPTLEWTQPKFEMPRPAVATSPLRKGWIVGRLPVEDALPPPSIKDAPVPTHLPESTLPTSNNTNNTDTRNSNASTNTNNNHRHTLDISSVVTPPLDTEHDLLEQQAQELMLVKTHQKSSEHLSLASEMDIDISNIRDSFINDASKKEREVSSIQRAVSDYAFSYNEGDSDVYGISDQDLSQIVEANDNEMFVKLRSASFRHTMTSLEPTLEGDLSDSVCSSMTNSFIFKPDDAVSAGTASMTSTYDTRPTPVSDHKHVDSEPVPTATDANNTGERLVVIKRIQMSGSPASDNSANNSLGHSPKHDSALSTTSTKTSSRRNSLDYEQIYSSITYDTLTPVGSLTTDAVAYVQQAQSDSKSTFEAQAVLQSIEEFLDTDPVIGTLPPDTVITPRVNEPEIEEVSAAPKENTGLYASLDDLLRETEDLLKQTLHE